MIGYVVALTGAFPDLRFEVEQVIADDDGGIVSVVGYFDQKTFVEQLGLQALVVPANEPPTATEPHQRLRSTR